MEPLRSLLFVPGNRERFLEKARSAPADALVPDLESGVPEPQKARARQMVRDALPAFAKAGKQVFVRVNQIGSAHLLADLNSVLSEHLTGVVLPQIASPDDIRHLDEMISSLEGGKRLPVGRIRIIPFIETALGVERAFEIATASSRVIAVAFGAEDFTADMGVSRSAEGTEFLFARNRVAVAARAAHKLAIDSPYVDISDAQGLERDARLAMRLGFKGKFAIHPDQLAVLNRVFSPSPEEVREAKRILAAFERVDAETYGTGSLDGKMIDTAIALRAQKLLRDAEAVSRKDGLNASSKAKRR